MEYYKIRLNGSASLTRSILLPLVIVGITLFSQSAVGSDELSLLEIRRLLDTSSNEISASQKANIGASLLQKIAQNSNNAEAYVQLARYYLMLGYRVTRRGEGAVYEETQLNKSREASETAISLNAGIADAYIPYGNYFEGTRQYEKAIEQYERAEALGSRNPWLYERWGRMLALMENDEAAVEKFQFGLALNSDNRYANGAMSQRLGFYFQKTGDFATADSYFRQQLDFFPNNAWVYGTYSEFLRRDLQDIDGAIFYGEKALELSDYGVGRRILASAYLVKWAQLQPASVPEAGKFYENAIALFPNITELFYWLVAEPSGAIVAKPLVDIGININTVGPGGNTPLGNATATSQHENVQELLKLGADATIPNEVGATPIELAAYLGNLELVELLLAHVPHGPTEILGRASAYAQRGEYQEIADTINRYYEKGTPLEGKRVPQ